MNKRQEKIQKKRKEQNSKKDGQQQWKRERALGSNQKR